MLDSVKLAFIFAIFVLLTKKFTSLCDYNVKNSENDKPKNKVPLSFVCVKPLFPVWNVTITSGWHDGLLFAGENQPAMMPKTGIEGKWQLSCLGVKNTFYKSL